jgi:hypothetical protein
MPSRPTIALSLCPMGSLRKFRSGHNTFAVGRILGKMLRASRRAGTRG